MSGGHFDYKQYNIRNIADEISEVLERQGKERHKRDMYGSIDYYNNNPEEKVYETYSPEVQSRMRCSNHNKKAYVYAQRIDWFLSGDDGEDSFLSLNEDLGELEE